MQTRGEKLSVGNGYTQTKHRGDLMPEGNNSSCSWQLWLPCGRISPHACS